MKNEKLTYIMFGVFVIIVITAITCSKNKGEETQTLLPEAEVKEIVEVKVEEVKEAVENRLKEVLPDLEILKEEEPIEVEVPVEAPIEEEAPVEEEPTEEPVEGEDDGQD